MVKQEQIAPVGYVNDELRHALVSIYEPPLINSNGEFVQVALTIEGAELLRDHLTEFLIAHKARGRALN